MHTSQRPLQDMFEATFRKQVTETVLLKAICELLSRYGIHLATSQKARLQRAIRSGTLESINIALTKQQQRLLGDKKLDLASIDSATLEKLYDETFSSIDPKIPSK